MSTIPRTGEKGCFETFSLVRELPTLEKELRPFIDEGIDLTLSLIEKNLRAIGVKPSRLESLSSYILTSYSGLSLRANIESRSKLTKQVADYLNFMRENAEHA